MGLDVTEPAPTVPPPLSGAIIDGEYRYRLWRMWAPAAKVLVWVMLNPSTADAETDDPTIRRCIGFSKREGCGGLIVLNLYALRSPSPTALRSPPPEPHHTVERSQLDRIDWISRVVGPKNDAQFTLVLHDPSVHAIVCAWGASGPSFGHEHERDVHRRLVAGSVPVLCLGRVHSGAPRHPLYVHRDQPFESFSKW